MNLDALTNSGKIRDAVNKVKSPERRCSWVLLGYVDKRGASRLMTIDVKREGNVWSDLLDEFKDDRIQYAYAKMEFEDKTKLFLIHWIGKKVSENLKESCMPHLNEVRNLIPTYDLLVCKMDILHVQAEVQSFLCRMQSIQISGNGARSRVNSMEEYPRPDVDGRIVEYLTRSEGPRIFEATERHNVHVKVAIIGKSGVGKTFIYLSYQGGGYALTDPQGIESSVAPDCMSKDVRLDQHEFTLEIWDTAGQEKYVAFAPVWTRHAKVVICVYDITDKMGYNEIPRHLQMAKQYADPKAIFFLVGNKADLVHRREVEEADGEKFANEHGMMFIECSGLTGLNILNLFENITRQVVCGYPDIFKLPNTNKRTRAPPAGPMTREDLIIRLQNHPDLKTERGGGGCKC